MSIKDIISQFKRQKNSSIIIYGATASGKSALALEIANQLQDAIIINSDSMQIYKEIPIITAQPSDLTGHYLYGFLSYKDKSFSVARWLVMVRDIINFTNKIPIIVGGTGMYISSLINGLSQIPLIPDEITKNVTNDYDQYGLEYIRNKLSKVDSITAKKFSDKQRIIRALSVYQATGKTIFQLQMENHQYIETEKIMKIWVKLNRNIIYERINKRFIEIIQTGAIDEARALIEKNFDNLPKAIGLKEIIQYIKDEISKENMISIVQQITRNYAKRQETWFRNQIESDIIL